VRLIVPGISEPTPHHAGTEEFYGLSTRPFALTPDLRFVYQSRSHSEAYKEVTDALQRREGLVVITGEIGTGKTVLCRALLETFHEARTFLSVILDPLLSVDDLLYQVLGDFGLITPDARTSHKPLPEATRHQLVKTLHQFLSSLIPLNAHAVILIDEAQHLTPPVLEQIRLLSNFETDRAKLLQIVLVGQPNLETMLRQPDLRQLDQRVARRVELYPLSGNEVQDYIARRLAAASASTVPFTPDAIAAVQRISAGIPRVVNTLCDRALEIGCERQLKRLDQDVMHAAADRLKLVVPASMPTVAFGGRELRNQPPTFAIAAAAVALLLLLLGWRLFRAAPAPASPPPAQAAQSATRPQPTAQAPATAPSAAPPPAAANAPTGSAAPAATRTNPTPPVPPAPQPTKVGTAPVSPNSYRIAVAAFRTSRRATGLAADIAAMGLPVTMHLDSTGQWYQVVVGPFTSAESAANAQQRLAREGFTDLRITAPASER
jgi:general secretion pathway protein A